jgi:8-oxo-dGTP diphosphatase
MVFVYFFCFLFINSPGIVNFNLLRRLTVFLITLTCGMKEKKFCYEYARAALSADCVLFGFDGYHLYILLVERGKEPFKGQWAFPGGFMGMEETIRECALRELKEETGVVPAYLEQLHTFSQIDRDPRGRVITVAYIAMLRMDDYNLVAGDDAADAFWFKVEDAPPLSFDHDRILEKAIKRLRLKIRYGDGAFELLNDTFTIIELERLVEAAFDQQTDSGHYCRKMLDSGFLVPVGLKKDPSSGQEEEYYRFNKEKFDEQSEKFVYDVY